METPTGGPKNPAVDPEGVPALGRIPGLEPLSTGPVAKNLTKDFTMAIGEINALFCMLQSMLQEGISYIDLPSSPTLNRYIPSFCDRLEDLKAMLLDSAKKLANITVSDADAKLLPICQFKSLLVQQLFAKIAAYECGNDTFRPDCLRNTSTVLEVYRFLDALWTYYEVNGFLLQSNVKQKSYLLHLVRHEQLRYKLEEAPEDTPVFGDPAKPKTTSLVSLIKDFYMDVYPMARRLRDLFTFEQKPGQTFGGLCAQIKELARVVQGLYFQVPHQPGLDP